ncbi:hypothetical protein PTSG_11769 [Salpingoeca rosetta]|uniref:Uncharacterized protein n=1 Tax=Salpingoeca rosetta (strain ATCC 50818 / BSB-021) TaxID=946362 RepID=F2TYP4_SALR5|nr:uncharacterized protein PTSG_11769 [Salpingoeca rosetta]EGD78718.1 hypothetical protein PTSG_11769 [Salpingoeca rosetta]|eukprot:XP_004997675.1 hypothetical protein PTSG_11769 [Salpingoeca rosetta]
MTSFSLCVLFYRHLHQALSSSLLPFSLCFLRGIRSVLLLCSFAAVLVVVVVVVVQPRFPFPFLAFSFLSFFWFCSFLFLVCTRVFACVSSSPHMRTVPRSPPPPHLHPHTSSSIVRSYGASLFCVCACVLCAFASWCDHHACMHACTSTALPHPPPQHTHISTHAHMQCSSQLCVCL